MLGLMWRSVPLPEQVTDQHRLETASSVHKCLCIEMCFARGLFRLSVAIRGLPQDAAVPSRCRRRESPEKNQI